MKKQTRKQQIKSYAPTLERDRRAGHTHALIPESRLTVGRFAKHAKMCRKSAYNALNAVPPKVTAVIAPETGKLQIILDKRTRDFVAARMEKRK